MASAADAGWAMDRAMFWRLMTSRWTGCLAESACAGWPGYAEYLVRAVLSHRLSSGIEIILTAWKSCPVGTLARKITRVSPGLPLPELPYMTTKCERGVVRIEALGQDRHRVWAQGEIKEDRVVIGQLAAYHLASSLARRLGGAR